MAGLGNEYLRHWTTVSGSLPYPFLSPAALACVLMTAVSAAAAKVDYSKDIKPVLKERCYACHGALKQKAQLRLDTVKDMRGAGILQADDDGSIELLRRLHSADQDERMPPEGHALTPDQIASISSWLEAGAPAPQNERREDDPLEHWAFQKIVRPTPPSPRGIDHPVDAFLAAKRNSNGLASQSPAPRSVAIRRLHLNLTGLPPTKKELADSRPWEAIVDDLLRSPHHGERWARHWMDIWRYSDWYGLGAQLRYSQKHLWHWRDWIIESLNADKGYDEMIREMLAGDEIAPGDPKTVRATGFLARNYFLFNRTTWLDSTIEHTGKAFLGLTLNCAKCHDHKYDPIEMTDYYRFRAIFEPHQVRLDPVPGFADLDQNGLPRVFDDHLEAVTYVHQRGDPKQPDKETPMSPAVPAFLSGFARDPVSVDLPSHAWAPGSRDYAREDRLNEARNRLDTAIKKLAEVGAISGSPSPSEPEDFPDAKPFSPIREDFSELNPELWKIEGEGLEFREGRLEQVTPSRSPGRLVLQRPLPRDFELTCRYTTTGGPTYRSVTFRFDEDEARKNANFIYTSEHAPGPKVQAAHTRSGKTVYPIDGKKGKPPVIGRPQELRFAVRHTLANIWLDGELVLAYRFPNRRNGSLALSAFDATAVFHLLEIRPLPEDMTLSEASNRAAENPGDRVKKLEKAQLEVEAARAKLAAVEATIAADRFRHANPGSRDIDLENAAAMAQVEADQLQVEVDLAGGDSKKQKAARELKKKVEAKLAAIEQGEIEYTPLKASRKALETPEHQFSDYPSEFPTRSTGRRTMLADWITHRDNPLTARVAVNHVWMRHFGEPLVESVFDFGRAAKPPLHRDLLDYLAVEFIESGWSFRHLHRLLVTSKTYRRTSSNAGAAQSNLDADPSNRFYWRMNPRRMESQIVRDSLLHLSGQLDPALGGQSLDSGKTGNRRSLYFTHSPDKLDRFLTAFDDADLQQCYRRNESVVPQQALALSNSKLSFDAATRIADQLADLEEDRGFVERAFFLILAREPEDSETAECLRFLADIAAMNEKSTDPPGAERGRIQLVHALLNHNDFITIR